MGELGITLEEFVADEQRRIIRFAEWWREEARLSPPDYPMVMGPGDWDEQYLLFADEEE